MQTEFAFPQPDLPWLGAKNPRPPHPVPREPPQPGSGDSPRLASSDLPKPFACHLCSYRSAWKANLQKHLRTHSGEKPFGCSLCDYRSSNQSNVRSHVITVHRMK